MPRSVPAPVIVLLLMVRFEAVVTSIAVDAAPAPPKPRPTMVLPVKVPPALPEPICTAFWAFSPAGRASAGPMVLPDTCTVDGPLANSPLRWNPVNVVLVIVTVRGVPPTTELTRIPFPITQPECWVMSSTVTLETLPAASANWIPARIPAQSTAKPVPRIVRLRRCIDVPRS